MDTDSLGYYATPGRFTALDDDALALASSDIHEVVARVQDVLVYDLAAQPFYGIELTAEQSDTINERDTAALLAVARRVGGRVGARCHIYSRLTVALLRAAGVPARARCGFGAYFQPGWLEDHWVAEYWIAGEQQWQMVDAQLDEKWRAFFKFDTDPLRITPEQFVTAGHAWQAWRRGDLDAGRCGLTSIDEHGAHWIAGNLRLDFASLNKVEMLPWDVWGEHWQPGTEPTDAQLRLFDEIAELTVDADARFGELRSRYRDSDSLRMDGTVFNVFRGCVETV